MRKFEQSNNPHYLKGSSTNVSYKKANRHNRVVYNDSSSLINEVETIPIAELALDVPLQITSTKRSDKYLQMKSEKKSEKKKNKKSKKNKTKTKVDYTSSESDENTGDKIMNKFLETNFITTNRFLDTKQVHIVNTTIEMPEGAILSDSEDKNLSKHDFIDPHRALDIDLDM